MRKIQKNFKVSEEENQLIHKGAAETDRSQTGFLLFLVKRFFRGRRVKDDGTGQPT